MLDNDSHNITLSGKIEVKVKSQQSPSNNAYIDKHLNIQIPEMSKQELPSPPAGWANGKVGSRNWKRKLETEMGRKNTPIMGAIFLHRFCWSLLLNST